MDPQDIYLQNPSPSRNFASSAIDLTGTPTGLAISVPPSPSLDPADTAFARRRTSWGRVDPGQDPLRLPSSLNTRTVVPVTSGSTVYTINDDPFYSPTDEVSFARDFPFATVTTRYGSQDNAYPTSQAGPSTTSLIQQPSEFELDRMTDDDDDARLTTNMSHNGTGTSREPGYDEDPEQSAGSTPRSHRRTVRYSVTPSPFKNTGTVFKRVSQNLRRVSLRVVNLAGAGLENQIRLPGDNEGEARGRRSVGKKKDGEEGEDAEFPDLTINLPIRGRTLGCLDSNSKLRLALFNFLVHP
jgi:hypothetical protein